MQWISRFLSRSRIRILSTIHNETPASNRCDPYQALFDSLLPSDLGAHTDRRYISTIGIDYGVKELTALGRTVKVNFFDLAGSEDFEPIRTQFYENTCAAHFSARGST